MLLRLIRQLIEAITFYYLSIPFLHYKKLEYHPPFHLPIVVSSAQPLLRLRFFVWMLVIMNLFFLMSIYSVLLSLALKSCLSATFSLANEKRRKIRFTHTFFHPDFYSLVKQLSTTIKQGADTFLLFGLTSHFKDQTTVTVRHIDLYTWIRFGAFYCWFSIRNSCN